MERDFEQEFRELKQNEIPDLWNRIEAGLSEKNDSQKGTIKKRSVWGKWGMLIAACACAVMVLPAVSLLIRNKSYSGSASDLAADYVTEEISDDMTMAEGTESGSAEDDMTAAVTEAIAEDAAAEEIAEDAAPGDTDGMAAGAAAAADAGGYEAAAGASADMAAAPEEKESEALADATVENSQIQKSDEAQISGTETAVWGEAPDGQILEEVVVQIQKAETVDGESICQAVVLRSDPDNILECETQIALVCDADTEYDLSRGTGDGKELKEQGIYRATLRYDADDGRFVVLEAKIWEG